MQGPLHWTGSMGTKIMLFINLFISIYYTLYANIRYKLSAYFIALNILLIIFTIYGAFRLMEGNLIVYHGYDSVSINNFEYLKAIYVSLLPIYPFYVFTKEGYISERYIRRLAIILVPSAVILFFHMQYQNEMLALLSGSRQSEFTNNQGYLFLWLIPIIVFFRNRVIVQYLLFSLCIFFIIMGMKRGPMLIGSLCMICFFASSINSKSTSRRIFSIILFSLLLYLAINAITYFIETSDYFNLRITQTIEGDSSGRDEIYSRATNYFLNNTNIIHFLFGNGADSTIRLFGSLAHNDWVELAINQGVMGLLAYLFYWFSFYKEWKKNRRRNDFSFALGLLLLISFMQTLFSMSYNAMIFYEALVLAYCLANNKKGVYRTS